MFNKHALESSFTNWLLQPTESTPNIFKFWRFNQRKCKQIHHFFRGVSGVQAFKKTLITCLIKYPMMLQICNQLWFRPLIIIWQSRLGKIFIANYQSYFFDFLINGDFFGGGGNRLCKSKIKNTQLTSLILIISW